MTSPPMHREPNSRTRRAALIAVPVTALAAGGLIIGRSVLSSPDTALASADVARARSASSATATHPPTPQTPSRADLGVAKVRKGKSELASTKTSKIKNPATRPPVAKASSGGESGASGGSAAGSAGLAATSAGVTDQVVSLTNAERAKAGCQALSVNAKLTASAQGHSADMAANNYFSHDSQDGRSPFDRMKAAGYSFSAAAENIAMGQPTASAVVTAWMNSPGHKANIVNCTYTEIGIGYAIGNGSPYWTQNFGKPL